MTTRGAFVVEPWERLAVVGKTQSGKTHFIGLLAKSIERLIVIDPKGLLGDAYRKANGKYLWHLSDVNSREGRKARESLEKGGPGRLRFPFPIGGNYEPVFRWAYGLRNCTVYIDEMYGANDSTKPGTWLNALYTRGAELKIGVWAATQRPRNVPRVMFSEAEWKVLFRLTDPDDQARMAREIGPAALTPLPPRAFLLYNDAWDAPIPYPYATEKTARRTRVKG